MSLVLLIVVDNDVVDDVFVVNDFDGVVLMLLLLMLLWINFVSFNDIVVIVYEH